MTEAAEIILGLLGDNRFLAMTGAKNLVSGDDALTFDLPGRTKSGINKVKVTEHPEFGGWVIDFYRLRGIDLKLVNSCRVTHSGMLRGVFAQITGLECTLSVTAA